MKTLMSIVAVVVVLSTLSFGFSTELRSGKLQTVSARHGRSYHPHNRHKAHRVGKHHRVRHHGSV